MAVKLDRYDTLTKKKCLLILYIKIEENDLYERMTIKEENNRQEKFLFSLITNSESVNK